MHFFEEPIQKSKLLIWNLNKGVWWIKWRDFATFDPEGLFKVEVDFLIKTIFSNVGGDFYDQAWTFEDQYFTFKIKTKISSSPFYILHLSNFLLLQPRLFLDFFLVHFHQRSTPPFLFSRVFTQNHSLYQKSLYITTLTPY